MEPVNLYDVEVGRHDDDPPGYDTGYVRPAPKLGGHEGEPYRLFRIESAVDYRDREVDR